MTISNGKLWDMIHAKNYLKALEILSDPQGVADTRPWHLAAAKCTVLMCLGRFSEAAAASRKADEFYMSEPHNPGPGYLKITGTAEWLAGRHQDASATWQRAVRGILDGTTRYADFAGGVSQGLLLWFAAHELKRPDLLTEAEKYLLKLSKRKTAESWPGPLALLVLARKSSEDIMALYLKDRIKKTRNIKLKEDLLHPDMHAQRVAAAEHLFDRYRNTQDVSGVVQAARNDTLLKRQLCQFLFYAAIRKRIDGDIERSSTAMNLCAGLENVIMENEWFLARSFSEN
jgi:hypothetical protein